MKRLFFTTFLCLMGLFSLNAQIIDLEIPSNESILVELTDSGYNIYIWGKKKGFMSKKMGAISSGAEEVEVRTLEVRQLDAAGKVLSQENYTVRLKDVDGLGKYQVTDKSISESGAKVIATADDPTMKELKEKYPNCKQHTGGSIENNSYIKDTEAKFVGGGLLGSKKPYSLNIKGRLDATEVADFPTGNPKAEWKTNPSTMNYRGKGEIFFPVWYQFYDKKDRFAYIRDYKFVGYDEEAKVVEEKDVLFKVPHQVKNTVEVVGSESGTKGHLFVFSEMFGLGWKKVNPEPQKDVNVLYAFTNGKLSGPFEMKSRAKGDWPMSPAILTASQSKEGIRLLIPIAKSTKKGIPEDVLDEHLCKDGTAELVKNHKLAPMDRSMANEPLTSQFVASVREGAKYVAQFGDKGALYMGYSQTTVDNKTTYGDFLFWTVNADGSLRHMGRLGTGKAASTRAPRINLVNISDDNILIDYSLNKRWICNFETGKLSELKPDADMRIARVMKEGNTFYFIGRKNTGDGGWIIEKKTL